LGFVVVAVDHRQQHLVDEWGECFDGGHHQPAQDAALLGDRLLRQPQVLSGWDWLPSHISPGMEICMPSMPCRFNALNSVDGVFQ
jgi:hypothetical protein